MRAELEKEREKNEHNFPRRGKEMFSPWLSSPGVPLTTPEKPPLQASARCRAPFPNARHGQVVLSATLLSATGMRVFLK